jgi:hypothetical protein
MTMMNRMATIPQDDEVVYRPRKADARDQPDQAGGVAELRGEHRTDEGPGSRNRREMMAEQHPFTGGVVVMAVVLLMGGGDARVVQHHDFRSDKRAVIPVRNGQTAEYRHDHVEGVHKDGMISAELIGCVNVCHSWTWGNNGRILQVRRPQSFRYLDGVIHGLTPTGSTRSFGRTIGAAIDVRRSRDRTRSGAADVA